MRKLFLTFILALLLVSTISALELNPFAEIKDYTKVITPDLSDFIKEDFNEKYGAITIDDTFMWIGTGRVAEYSLIENTEYCIINCKARGKVKLYSDGRVFEDK